MMPIRLLLVALLVMAAPVHAAPADDLRLLHSYDMRLAAIGWRLTSANAALCRELAPGTGLVLHGIDQYSARLRPLARTLFGFAAPVAVAGVVAGSPAERAGISAGDSLVAVAGRALPASSGSATGARDAAVAAIDAESPTAPLRLTVLRDGNRREVEVAPVPACRSAFEVTVGTGEQAQADGDIVQIGAAFLEEDDDAARLAPVVAHELAHNILKHRARVAAAGGKTGLASEFGRSARLSRIVEDEADRLSVHLLRNAGYDPASAVRFWQSESNNILRELLSGGSHASARQRARVLAAEIAAMPATGPSIPALLAQRDVQLPR